MALTKQQFEDLKKEFTRRFDDFLATRQREIGNRSGLTLSRVRLMGNNTADVFIRREVDKKYYSFSLGGLPDSIDRNDVLELLYFARNAAVKRGFFKAPEPESSFYDERFITAMRAGDNDAWQRFVDWRSPKLHRIARRDLQKGPPSYFEPEDVVQGALLLLFRRRTNPEIDLESHAELFTAREAINTIRGKNNRSQSDSAQIPEMASDEPDIHHQQQLVVLLSHAKTKMSDEEQRVLEMLLENITTEEPVSAPIIGDALDIHKRTVARILYERIPQIISSTAKELGPNYEDIVGHLDYLSRRPNQEI